jgi:hypothetical protein
MVAKVAHGTERVNTNNSKQLAKSCRCSQHPRPRAAAAASSLDQKGLNTCTCGGGGDIDSNTVVGGLLRPASMQE